MRQEIDFYYVQVNSLLVYLSVSVLSTNQSGDIGYVNWVDERCQVTTT